MLTENQLEMLGNQIAALYQALEQDVIADIARRVKKTKRFTETAELMAQAMKETGMVPDRIRAEVMKLLRADKAFQDEIAKNTKEWKEFVREEIKATEAAAKEAGNDIIANAGDMSFNYNMEAWQQAGMELTKDSAFTRMVEEMSKATAGTLKNLTRSTGFKGVHGTTALKNAYRQYLDKALIKMATGTFSYDQCVNDCVKELAQSGLRSIDYTSGRTYQLDTAARMAIRTANSQLAGQIAMHYIEETDTDLVEVSAHWGARPEHAVWHGKIYSRSGKNKKYPNFSVCHYGDIDGLKGINCRHDFYPFFEGISEPTTWPDEPKPKEYRGKTYDYYHATQKQRKMERDIRATKREIEAQKAIGGDTSLLEAQKRKQIKEYHNFSNAMGIRAKDNRLRVIAGTSELNAEKKTKKNPVRKERSLQELEKMERDSREYKELSLDEFQKMHHTVTKEERKILYGKTHFSGYINSSNARLMNEALRTGKMLNKEYQKIADTLSDVIHKNTISKDIVVTRFVSADALEPITGCKYPKTLGLLASKDDIEAYWQEIEKLPSRIVKKHLYEEKGFLSTSGVVDKNVMQEKSVRLNIKVPKETNRYITTNYKESEIIFDRGTKLEVLNAHVENNRTSKVKIVLDCIMR